MLIRILAGEQAIIQIGVPTCQAMENSGDDPVEFLGSVKLSKRHTNKLKVPKWGGGCCPSVPLEADGMPHAPNQIHISLKDCGAM